jgi:putative transcriptional regulator
MANQRLKSELIEGMRALQKIGVVDGATMREFEVSLLGPPPVFMAKDVTKLREKYGVSQAVFAAILNVSASTVQKWEQGQKAPGAAASKLLQVVKEHGLSILVPKDSRKAA